MYAHLHSTVFCRLELYSGAASRAHAQHRVLMLVSCVRTGTVQCRFLFLLLASHHARKECSVNINSGAGIYLYWRTVNPIKARCCNRRGTVVCRRGVAIIRIRVERFTLQRTAQAQARKGPWTTRHDSRFTTRKIQEDQCGTCPHLIALAIVVVRFAIKHRWKRWSNFVRLGCRKACGHCFTCDLLEHTAGQEHPNVI